jgi:hypothetical protein
VPDPPVHGEGTAWRHENDAVKSPSRGRGVPGGAYVSRRLMWWIGNRIAYNRRKTLASGAAASAFTISCPL